MRPVGWSSTVPACVTTSKMRLSGTTCANPQATDHIEDEAIWDDLCKSTGQKEGCTQFRVPALPDHGFPFPLTALGPFRLRETLDDRKSSRKDRPTRGNPNRVIVACRDSASKIQKLARKLNVDLDSFLVLSRKDNPELQTFDDIVATLPPGIELLLLDDVEYLFPPGQRDPDSVRDFLERMKARYGHLGFNLMATVSGTDPVLTMSMIQSMGCKEENDEQSSHSSK